MTSTESLIIGILFFILAKLTEGPWAVVPLLVAIAYLCIAMTKAWKEMRHAR